MSRQRAMRGVLMASAVFTLSGCALFGFPQSLPGQMAGLPADVPAVYRLLAALMMLLFGVGYLWLALQREIPRAGVLAGVIAKLVAFAALAGLLGCGLIPLKTLLACSGDLVLAIAMLCSMSSTEPVSQANADVAA